jgi:pyridoxine kinase
VLSTHTGGFDGYKFIDLTDHLEEYIRHWTSLGIEFDCIYSGFLGSPRQIDIISGFIESFRRPGQLVVIDPVMGDDGGLYSAVNTRMVHQMRRYIGLADIITPNYTEAVYLLDKPYKDSVDEEEIKEWLFLLTEQGPDIAIITSVPDCKSRKTTSVIAYNSGDGRFWKVKCDYIPAGFPGTGDGFASVMVGSIMQRDSLPIALDRAVQFISSAIRASYGHRYPEREGVLLERVLGNLKMPVLTCTYEIL